MKIAVIGSGYVGTTTAALLAATGHHVTAIDIDPNKVEKLNKSQAPFYENGLNALVAEGIETGQLKASMSYGSVKTADVIFSCVGTPDYPDGSSNLSYINDVAQRVAALNNKAIFVQKSTVPVGTGLKLKKILTKNPYISNPEFLREGTAIKDSILFERIVVGADNDEAAKVIHGLFEEVSNKREHIAKICEIELDEDLMLLSPKYLTTTINSAELIKVTANAFLALKISFANSVAKMADNSGADVTEVMDGIGYDRRIGRAFLNAGMGYGGGCFPKDVSGLISAAKELGVDFSIMNAATATNSSMPGYIVTKVNEKYGSVEGKKIAVLGLAFKPGTSDARRSPAAQIANFLVDEGALVSAYDPKANEDAKRELHQDISLVSSLEKAVEEADMVFIATAWPEFVNLDFAKLKTMIKGDVVVDCMNALDEDEIRNAKLKYVGVGR